MNTKTDPLPGSKDLRALSPKNVSNTARISSKQYMDKDGGAAIDSVQTTTRRQSSKKGTNSADKDE